MKKTGFLFIILAGLCWGTSCIFVHFLSPYGFTATQMTALRGWVALLCLGIYLLLRQRHRFRIRGKELVYFVASGASLFGTASCYYAAMQLTSVSTAAVLLYTAPALVMLYSVFFLGERFSLGKGISLVCMLVGCGLVSGITDGFTFDAVGLVLGILSGVLYAAYNIFSKLEVKKGADPVSATFYCFATISVIALVVAKPTTIPAMVAIEPLTVLLLILGIGIVTFVLPYLLYTIALKEVPAGTASALAITEPMAATLYSVLFLSETLTLPAICGILLILFAVVLLSRGEHPVHRNKHVHVTATCDLHTHSNCSDGTMSPTEVIAEASRAGLVAVALTDHNTVEGLAEFCKAAVDAGITPIRGVEISTDHTTGELHIVGLYLPEDKLPLVTERLSQLVANKRASITETVERLQAAGYALDLAELESKTPSGVFNRAHIAEALMARGYASSIKEAFATLLAKDSPYYVPTKRLPAFETISFLASIGAVPVLAHPFLDLTEAELRDFLPMAKEAGLVAMETRYSTYDADTSALARAIAKEYGLAESGGSDFHGTRKPDIAIGRGRGSLVVPLELATKLATYAK